MAITATEEGRHLVLTLGDGQKIRIKPVPAAKGAELAAQWLNITFGRFPTIEELGEAGREFSRGALSGEHEEILAELRAAELAEVVNAAFYWNVQGGGLNLVQRMLQDGHPKGAQRELLESMGLWENFEAAQEAVRSALRGQLRNLPSGESESPIPSPAATPDTTSPTGIEPSSAGSSESSDSAPTVAKLPAAKRSIRQNVGRSSASR